MSHTFLFYFFLNFHFLPSFVHSFFLTPFHSVQPTLYSFSLLLLFLPPNLSHFPSPVCFSSRHFLTYSSTFYYFPVLSPFFPRIPLSLFPTLSISFFFLSQLYFSHFSLSSLFSFFLTLSFSLSLSLSLSLSVSPFTSLTQSFFIFLPLSPVFFQLPLSPIFHLRPVPPPPPPLSLPPPSLSLSISQTHTHTHTQPFFLYPANSISFSLLSQILSSHFSFPNLSLFFLSVSSLSFSRYTPSLLFLSPSF